MTKRKRVPALLWLGLIALSHGSLDGVALAADAPALEHFEFVEPAGGPWQVDRSASAMGGVTFLRREGRAAYQIALLENVVLGPEARKASAAWVADDFRASEKAGMLELGVGTGQYQLRDVEMGEETIGGKLYYTMSYVTQASSHYERARLYLYFPYPEANEYFLVAHYSEMARRHGDLKTSHEADFRQLLGTVSHRPAEPTSAAGPAESRPASLPAQGFARDFALAHALTQSDLPRKQLKVKCQVKVDESYVSLIETPETGVG